MGHLALAAQNAMKRLVLAVALILGVSSPAFAADDDGKFTGRGTISCAKWLDGKTNNTRKTANIWWLQGLMTGMNAYVEGKADWLDYGENRRRAAAIQPILREEPLA